MNMRQRNNWREWKYWLSNCTYMSDKIPQHYALVTGRSYWRMIAYMSKRGWYLDEVDKCWELDKYIDW
jgi:hypothetical protein